MRRERSRAGRAGLVLVVGLLAGGLAVAGLARGPNAGSGATSEGRAEPAERPRSAPPLRGHVLDTIGVVSFNAYRHLGFSGTAHDWRRLARRDDVDVIGWQETKSDAFAALHPRFEDAGWSTWHHPDPTGPISVAVSWRRSTFRLLDLTWHRMHPGGPKTRTEDPFPPRYVVTARFRHVRSGRSVTLLNTHVNQAIEVGEGWQDNLNATRARRHLRTMAPMWDATPGRVVVGTGDFNYDHRDDSRARPRGGITRRFEGEAVSSYDALGRRGVVPTLRSRWIDYVWLADRSIRGAVAQFATHRSLDGYRSDHRPMLARIRLYR